MFPLDGVIMGGGGGGGGGTFARNTADNNV